MAKLGPEARKFFTANAREVAKNHRWDAESEQVVTDDQDALMLLDANEEDEAYNFVAVDVMEAEAADLERRLNRLAGVPHDGEVRQVLEGENDSIGTFGHAIAPNPNADDDNSTNAPTFRNPGPANPEHHRPASAVDLAVTSRHAAATRR